MNGGKKHTTAAVYIKKGQPRDCPITYLNQKEFLLTCFYQA